MNRQEAKDAIIQLITDPTNNQNTAAKVREALDVIIDSATNSEDDYYTSPQEQTVEVSFGSASADLSTRKSTFILVTESFVLDATGMKAGETYTFFLTQAADTATVTLRGTTFLNQSGFNMVTGDGNSSMFQAYCHNNGTEEVPDLKLYCFPQQDFS